MGWPVFSFYVVAKTVTEKIQRSQDSYYCHKIICQCFFSLNMAMAARLTKALEFANYRITLNNQLEALRAKTQSLLSYSTNGGTFTIDRTLISFCKTLIDEGHEKVVLLDIYNNPIEVELKDFYDEILMRYFEVTNEFHVEYNNIRKARSVSKAVDLNE